MTLTGEEAGPVTRAGPWWWTRRRGLVLDASLAVVSALECAAEGAGFAEGHGLWPLPGAVAGLLVGGLLLLRRRRPVAVLLVALAVTPVSMGLVMSMVSLYTVAASKLPRRVIVTLVSMMGAAVSLVAFVEMNSGVLRHDLGASPWFLIGLAVLIALGLTAPPVLLGLYVGARRRLVESLRERADGLERELSLLAEKAGERAERARIEERTRIAREMHDVVAHRVSLMVVHASALGAVLRTDPDRAEDSARLLGDMGRRALGELRQMVGVLRTGADEIPGPGADGARVPSSRLPQGEPPPAGPVAGPTDGVGAAPPGDGAGDAPGDDEVCLARLEALVEQSRAAGMPVTLAQEGTTRPLAERVERAAYRVVQEALTNAHKHAVGAATLVRVAYRDEEIAVLVENGPPDGRPSPGLPSGGNGLLGMRERVTALGGGFVAGPRDGGGFRVSAVIPAVRRTS